MKSSPIHILNYCGFPAFSDLQDANWRTIFGRLEDEQSEFLSHETKFRSAEYRWPRDPLHTWSRLWEYPYVLHHLQNIRKNSESRGNLKVTDLGSGVTFFPFSAARLGYDVTCVDVDAICERDLSAAARVMNHAPGNVDVAIVNGKGIPLHDETQDVAYCISVLEHIPDFPSTLSEIARILKPKGKFILTVDIDLRGDAELSTEAFQTLQAELAGKFVKICPERILHPGMLLTSENSTFPYRYGSTFPLVKALVRRVLRGQGILKPQLCQYLTVYACALEKT